MASGCVNVSSANCHINDQIEWKFEDTYNHKDCSNLTYDGTRLRWSGSFQMLQDFVECGLKMHGNWSSLGGSAKNFTCRNSDITITWYARKQNTIVLHGNRSLILKNILIKVCKVRGTTINEEMTNTSSVKDGELPKDNCMSTVNSSTEVRNTNDTA